MGDLPPELRHGLPADFLRMLQCASRFGDDLHMHAHKEMVGVLQQFPKDWERSKIATSRVGTELTRSGSSP